MILTGLLGYLSCAPAGAAASARHRAVTTIPRRFIGFPPVLSFCGLPSTFSGGSGSLDAVQAMRRVLDGKEQHVAHRLGRMHNVRRNVDDRAGLRLDRLVADTHPERPFE